MILLDCGQSWIYPAGDEPGAYALPPDAEPPPGAVLEVRARHADGDPFYDVYCVEGKGWFLSSRQASTGFKREPTGWTRWSAGRCTMGTVFRVTVLY